MQNDVPLNKSNLTPHLILFEYQYEFLFPTDWKLAQCVWWHPLSPHHWLSKLLWLRSAASAIADAVQCAGCQVSRSFLPTSSGLTVSAKQRRRIQSRNGPGKKLSLLLSFGYLGGAAGLTNRSRTTTRWSGSITLTISCKKMWYTRRTYTGYPYVLGTARKKCNLRCFHFTTTTENQK